MLAPVSTMNCTARPLIVPCDRKWPPLPADSTIRLPREPAPEPPMLTCDSPIRSVCFLPLISTTAWSPSVASTLTPWWVSPGATPRGSPPSTTSSALLPSMPCSDTDCAAAAPASASIARPVSRRRISRGSC